MSVIFNEHQQFSFFIKFIAVMKNVQREIDN